MNLRDLLTACPWQPDHSVPDWMIGCFRRRSISFYDGTADVKTKVWWLQSRNFTIDLRLPVDADQVSPSSRYEELELTALANYEGWQAQSVWDGRQLSWHGGTSLQDHNRWPEPALLQRVGNCMIEFAPSGAYVEDWRLQQQCAGPLIGLYLLEEKDLDTNDILHRGGGLIVCANQAALVRGRSGINGPTDPFRFETSLAQGSVDEGFHITDSTIPARVKEPLLSLDGFEWQGQQLRQIAIEEGRRKERLFNVDVIEPDYSFHRSTPTTDSARAWFARESATLQRYSDVIL